MDTKRISQSNILAKECIVSALLQLIYRKPLSAITISELCQKAGVSRMTFYRNYESKEEVFTKHLSEIFQKYREDECSKLPKGIFYDQDHMIHYFTYLSRYKEFMDGLVYCGFGIYFLEMMTDYLNEKWGKDASPYTLAAFAGALYNSFNLWSSRDYADKPELLASNLSKIFHNSED